MRPSQQKNDSCDLKQRFKNKLRSTVMAANYYLGSYQDAIWLVGEARSGTTWVSDLINWDKRYREMFEPFHPTFSEKFRF